MSIKPFTGRCHTCGHDHDAEETLLRDVLDICKPAPAVPVALLWQVRRALARASAICDAVPNRQEGHLGTLVNVQPDGTHGYREIQEAEAALVAYLTTPGAAQPPQAAQEVQRAPLTEEQIDAGIEAWFASPVTTAEGRDRGHPFRTRMRAAITAAMSAAPQSDKE